MVVVRLVHVTAPGRPREHPRKPRSTGPRYATHEKKIGGEPLPVITVLLVAPPCAPGHARRVAYGPSVPPLAGRTSDQGSGSGTAQPSPCSGPRPADTAVRSEWMLPDRLPLFLRLCSRMRQWPCASSRAVVFCRYMCLPKHVHRPTRLASAPRGRATRRSCTEHGDLPEP